MSRHPNPAADVNPRSLTPHVIGRAGRLAHDSDVGTIGPRLDPCVCGAPRHEHRGRTRQGGHANGCRRYRLDPAYPLAWAAHLADSRSLYRDALDYDNLQRAGRPPRAEGEWSLGPSDVTTCPRAIWYRNLPPDDLVTNPTDKHAAVIGGIIHDGYQRAQQELYPWRLFERYVEVPGLDREGRYDSFDPITGVLTDIKTAGDWVWDHLAADGPDEDVWEQPQLYGLALTRLGYTVRTVRLVYVERKSGYDEPYERPYDEQAALAALDRLVGYATALDNGEVLPRSRSGPSTDPICRRYCFAPETEVVTREGIRPIGDLAGTRPALLVPAQQNGGLTWHGEWRECDVREYGTQPLRRVTMRRGRSRKVVYATPEHRWLTSGVGRPGRQHEAAHFSWRIATTDELRPGSRLRSIRRDAGTGLREVPFAVAQGFVYGDGTAPGGSEGAGYLPIYDASPKDQAILPYFATHETRRTDKGVLVTMLPRTWKDAPRLDESRSFLLSWLAGYVAADGTVSKSGQVTVSSADRASVDLVRSVCAIVGVGYGPVRTESRTGFGTEPSDLHTVGIRLADLPSWFFKIEEHRRRAVETVRADGRRSDWTVESVEETNRVEPVYCAEVPGVEAFALADELLTMNCEFRDHCWNIPQAERMGRSPENLTLVSFSHDNAAWAAGERVKASAMVSAAKAAEKQAKALVDGLEPGRYGDYEVSEGARTVTDWQRTAALLRDYYALPEDERPRLETIPEVKRRDTWVQVKPVRKAKREKEARDRATHGMTEASE